MASVLMSGPGRGGWGLGCGLSAAPRMPTRSRATQGTGGLAAGMLGRSGGATLAETESGWAVTRVTAWDAGERRNTVRSASVRVRMRSCIVYLFWGFRAYGGVYM